MAYSADLRNKALNYYEQCKNISQTAATFNLSRNTLYLWIRLKKQTGSLKHQVTGLNAVKLDRQKLAQYVGQHPDAGLAMQPRAIAHACLNGMAEGMSEIENGAQTRLSLVSAHHLRLDLTAAPDGMGQHLRLGDFVVLDLLV